MTAYRIESDALGNVKVPKNKLWGAQTERSRNNFTIGPKMPLAIIHALLNIKKAAAIVNKNNGSLDANKSNVIVKSVDQILNNNYQNEFPLKVFQTGSGTQSNMNVNEVISHVAQQDFNTSIHPNDDVNKAQSSNDTFPTAMMITANYTTQRLIRTLKRLINSLNQKAKAFKYEVKIGRTHLQDATPITFGQEVSGWVDTLQHDLKFLKDNQNNLLELPIGGTAVGNGLNTPKNYDKDMVEQLSKQLRQSYQVAKNKFHGLMNHSSITMIHGILKTLASDLIKIANDIRFLASGPRAGYNEINIPSNEPGSSIMPGKVNPTQIEALTMACSQVIGHDTTINIAESQGNFEMNVYKPIMIYDFLNSANILNGTIDSFTKKLINGITVNHPRMKELVDNSLMLVTALSPHIGYEKSAKIAQKAQKEGTTLKESALNSGINEKDFEKWVNAKNMTNIDRKDKN